MDGFVYSLYLVSIGSNKNAVVAAVAEIRNITFDQAEFLINTAKLPWLVKDGYTSFGTINNDDQKLYDAGATTTIKTTRIVDSGYTFSIQLIDSYTQGYYNYPVAYATVKLYTGENGQFITSGKTDTEGKFTYFTRSSNSDYIGAPKYAIIEKLRFISINKTLQWKTVATSITENSYALSTNPYFSIYMEPKGFIYFKPKYYDKSDFTYKDYTGTIEFSINDAITHDDMTSDFSIPSIINPDENGYYYPTVSESVYDYIDILYNYIDSGMVYFKLQCKNIIDLQSDDIAVIYFYPYKIFNSTGATDYTIQKQLTFYPVQKKLTISNLERCYVSEYTHRFFKPNSNNTEYIRTFCPTTVDIRDNYYQNIQGYGLKLPSVEQLAPYNVSSFRIVLCVYENETYMYNGDAPTQYGGAKITVQSNGYTTTYNDISALTSTYTSVTTSSIYFTSKVKITLSDISAGLTFEKEKEEFYFIPGITEIRFNACKNSSPNRTIQVNPKPTRMSGKSTAQLICSCLEGKFERSVTLTCNWRTTGTTRQSFTFTIPSGSDTYSRILQPSANLDYNDTNWSLSFADPSQAIADGYVDNIDIIKDTQYIIWSVEGTTDNETTIYVRATDLATDLQLIFTNDYDDRETVIMHARASHATFLLPFAGTISLYIPSPTDALYNYEYEAYS